MATVYIDRDGADIVVRVPRLSKTEERRFADRAEAERFAASKLGKRSGMIVSTLDMTEASHARQLAEALQAMRMRRCVRSDVP